MDLFIDLFANSLPIDLIKYIAPNLLDSSGLGDYIKGITFESSFILIYIFSLLMSLQFVFLFVENIKPKIASLIDYLHGGGMDKIVLVGYSWGSWVAANILASDLAEHFVCAALPTPSLNLEERMYGGSMIELFTRIQRPLLLFPGRVSQLFHCIVCQSSYYFILYIIFL